MKGGKKKKKKKKVVAPHAMARAHRPTPLLLLFIVLLACGSATVNAADVSGTVWWDIDRNGDVTNELFGTGVTNDAFFLFADTDANGVHDVAYEEWTETAPDGTYTIRGVTAASVRITLLPPVTCTLTYPATNYHAITIAGNVNNIDFGFSYDITVSGYVWDDNGYDGINNPAYENPIPGWTIYNDANLNGALDTGEDSGITDSNGEYSFTTPAGIVSITSQQNGLKFITYPPTPLRIYDSVTRSSDWSGLDFGQADITVTIYGYVYADYAGDGLWNDVILPDEPITGVTVWDDANFNRQLDTGEAFGLTDSTGNFSMLLPTHSLNFTALVFQLPYSERLVVPTPGPSPLTPDYVPILPNADAAHTFTAPLYPLPLVFSLRPYTILNVTSGHQLIRDNYNGVIDAGDTILFTYNITNIRFLFALNIYITLVPDNSLLRVLRSTVQLSTGVLTVNYDYPSDETKILAYITRLEPNETITITFEAQVRIFAYEYSRLISGWLNITGQLFDDVHYRFPNVLNSDLCLTTYTAFPYARRQADDATAPGGGGGDGDEEAELYDQNLVERIPGSTSQYPTSGRELLRLLETLRLDQTKNSKRLSAVLRRWSCLTFNTTDDAADEFKLVLDRLFYFGQLPVPGFSCPQPSTLVAQPYVQLFGPSTQTGYQAKAAAALREGNFNMSGYAIHYMDTYMDFYLLFIHLEDIDSHYCPYVTAP